MRSPLKSLSVFPQWPLIATFAVTAACQGQIGESGGIETGTTPGGTQGAGGSSTTGLPPEQLPPYDPAEPALARLTGAQYANVVRDLLGPAVKIPDLEADTRPYLFSVIGASTTTISEHGVDLYGQSALTIAGVAFADTTKRAALVPCPVTTPLTAECLGQFIQTFGLRAWRRPLEAVEVQRYQAYGAQVGLGDPWKALEYVTAGLLTSPNFLYRVELGEADPEHPGWLRYTGYEMASRLSFLLRNTFPDAELFAAAKSGELVTVDGILGQANRLLGAKGPTAEMIKQLYSEYLDLPLLAEVMFPKTMDPGGTIGASMQSEVVGIVNRIGLEQPGDMRTVFTTRTTFVNQDLASLYGLAAPAPGGLAQAELPADGPRAGILTTGALLTLNNRPNRTSPTIRGFFVRQRLLCGTVPPPPPGIPPIKEDDMGAPKTIREKLEAHRANATCAACHKQMDPLGLGMENFDQFGRFRAMYESGAPVDATGDLDGQMFDGARQLGELLSKDERTVECLITQLYRYASSRLETDSETIVLANLKGAFAKDGYQLKPLLLSLIGSDGFRHLKPEAP
jgi:hypothetical protein